MGTAEFGVVGRGIVTIFLKNQKRLAVIKKKNNLQKNQFNLMF